MHAQETVCQVSYSLYKDAWHVMRFVNFFFSFLVMCRVAIYRRPSAYLFKKKIFLSLKNPLNLLEIIVSMHDVFTCFKIMIMLGYFRLSTKKTSDLILTSSPLHERLTFSFTILHTCHCTSPRQKYFK